MRRLLLIAAAVLGLAACRHDNEPNKIIDGVPVDVSATVPPVQATQEYLLLKRDLLTVVIPVINKFSSADSVFPELTALGSGNYQFIGTDAHYGTATFVIGFQDPNGVAIDPVAVRSSSNTIYSVTAAVTGSSGLYTYTENLVLRLETAGVIDSTRKLSGTSAFTGINGAAGYALNFSMTDATAIFQGLFAGQATATGTGPSQPVTVALNFATNRNADGNVSWEGQEGTFHIEVTGPAYVVTGSKRIFLD